MERQTIRIDRQSDGITWLIMNRPEKRNAMSPQLHQEMYEALLELESDDATKVLLLTGAGDSFSAGQDLKEFFRGLEANPKEQHRQILFNEWRWERLTTFPKVTIAVVNGWCVGGAFTQLLGCDLAIAAEDAKFCISEVNWGILPGGMVSKALATAMTYREALYYILTAEVFDGRKAAELKLVNYAVPRHQLRDSALALAGSLMEKNLNVLRAAKDAYRKVRTMDDEQARDYLAAKGAQLRLSDPENGYETGLSNFLQKTYRPAFRPYPKD